MKTLPMIFAAISAVMPVVTQRTGLSEKHGFKMKMLCALLYLITGILSAASLYRATAYSLMLLGALTFGILGDFFLEYKKKRFFPLGMAFFALGHLAYIITFLFVTDGKTLLPASAMAVIMFIVLFFIIRRLHFKKFRELIMLYSAVLVFFFSCAVAAGALFISKRNLSLGLCLAVGGTLFFASDLMIGVGKAGIERPLFFRNAVSYTYFAAQALFALSIYFQ